MKKYFLAGTFDNFHVGHQYLCWTAFEIIKKIREIKKNQNLLYLSPEIKR